MGNFPAPVGGVPLPLDFAPSLIFAGLYALLIPLILYRMFSRRSRTVLLLGTVSFSIERIVIYTIRAIQSRDESLRNSHRLLNYMQVSFTMGYLSIASDTINFLRCLLINPTYGSDTFYMSPAASSKGSAFTVPPIGTPDQPKTRFWARRYTEILQLLFFGAMIPGILGNAKYSKVLDSQSNADRTATLRYVSSAVALALSLNELVAIVWAFCRFPQSRLSMHSLAVISVAAGLTSIVAIYRLCIMHFQISSLEEPFILNQPRYKATFYIFQVLPEWVAIFMLLLINTRKTFGTGPFGDLKGRDTPNNNRKSKRIEEAIELHPIPSTSALILSEKTAYISEQS